MKDQDNISRFNYECTFYVRSEFFENWNDLSIEIKYPRTLEVV